MPVVVSKDTDVQATFRAVVYTVNVKQWRLRHERTLLKR